MITVQYYSSGDCAMRARCCLLSRVAPGSTCRLPPVRCSGLSSVNSHAFCPEGFCGPGVSVAERGSWLCVLLLLLRADVLAAPCRCGLGCFDSLPVELAAVRAVGVEGEGSFVSLLAAERATRLARLAALNRFCRSCAASSSTRSASSLAKAEARCLTASASVRTFEAERSDPRLWKPRCDATSEVVTTPCAVAPEADAWVDTPPSVSQAGRLPGAAASATASRVPAVPWKLCRLWLHALVVLERASFSISLAAASAWRLAASAADGACALGAPKGGGSGALRGREILGTWGMSEVDAEADRPLAILTGGASAARAMRLAVSDAQRFASSAADTDGMAALVAAGRVTL